MIRDNEIKRWREDTPGCAQRVHLNNAGAALMPTPVIQAIQNYIKEESNLGGYEMADKANAQIAETYEAIARLIGCSAKNIAIVENATVATSQALSAFDLQKGDNVITTNVDYSSNQIMLLNLAKKVGIDIIRARDLPSGGVDPNSVHELIQEHHPKLVLMSWIPTNSGLIQQAQEVGKICSEANIPFLLDGCQAIGQLPVNVSELHCDFFAATARKFLRGPRGVGFLYVSDKMLQQGYAPLFPDTRGATWVSKDEFELQPNARRFENWEFSYALVVGLGAAAKYAHSLDLKAAGKRAFDLAAYTREKLSALPGLQILDRGKNKCAIVTAAIKQTHAGELVRKLRKENISTSATTHSSGVIDMEEKGVKSALRISPHYYNTKDEIARLIDVLQRVI